MTCIAIKILKWGNVEDWMALRIIDKKSLFKVAIWRYNLRWSEEWEQVTLSDLGNKLKWMDLMNLSIIFTFWGTEIVPVSSPQQCWFSHVIGGSIGPLLKRFGDFRTTIELYGLNQTSKIKKKIIILMKCSRYYHRFFSKTTQCG